jgi:D-arginine dehydrogenase
LVARGEQVCVTTFDWPYGYSSEYPGTYELGEEFKDLRAEVELILLVHEDSLQGLGAWPLAQQALFREPITEAFRSAALRLKQERVRHELLTQSRVLALVPELSVRCFDGGVLLSEDGRIDVHELLSSYLRHARKRGVTVRLGAEVRGVSVDRGRCSGVVTDEGTIRAKLTVNAAGAWAEKISTLAGLTSVRLEPRRRTIITFAAPQGLDIAGWPFVISEADHLYFAPESGGLLLSPMDEEPFEPCDPQPDDLVIARALDRLAVLAPRLVPRSLGQKWSGLRTFTRDGVAVVGEDPIMPGFFWLAGQAGYGIETSGAVSQMAADLIVHGRTDLFDAAALSPARFVQSP